MILVYSTLSLFIFSLFKLTFTSCYDIYILEYFTWYLSNLHFHFSYFHFLNSYEIYFTWYLCTLESHFRRFTENEPRSDCHPKILKYSKYGKINVLEIFRMWKCQNMEPWSDCHPKYFIWTWGNWSTLEIFKIWKDKRVGII